MVNNNLKEKAISGLFWSLLEKFSTQIVAFVVGVILARLLSPADYGLIAMTAIFVSISQVLVDSGFTSALIQKIDKTDLDYSTVFDINVIMSAGLCFLLCLISPFVANFYNEPLLKWIVCFCGIKIFFGSFIAVQATRLTANLQFNARSRIAIVNSIISGFFAIVMAYSGLGVWSLVVPEFLVIISSAIMYWKCQHWFPGIKFSKESFRELFSFGSRLLASSILEIIYGNIYTIVIGKKFSASQLGIYSKAQGFANLPVNTISGVIANVSYPTLSKLQHDDSQLSNAYRKMIRLAAFVVFPLMICIVVLAKPLIVVLLTEKWMELVEYLQILCFSLMWYPIHYLNLNLLEVKGRSDLFLKLQVIKKNIGIIILIVSIPFGLYWMCMGQVFYSVISLFVNTFYTNRLLKIGFFKQILDITPSFIYSLLMGCFIYLLVCFVNSMYLQLIIGIVGGGFFYWLLSFFFHSKDLVYLEQIVRDILKK